MVLPECSGIQGRHQFTREEEPEEPRDLNWKILDHKNPDEDVPVWVYFFLRGNVSSIERTGAYPDQYAFVSANYGTNVSALRQWEAAFSPELDFARLAAARIEKRFSAIAEKYPDDEYGSFYEAMIRTAHDAQWEGAEIREKYWVSRSFPDPEDPDLETARYDFLILVTIGKTNLDRQIRTLLAGIKTETPLTRDQANAAAKAQEHFFDDF